MVLMVKGGDGVQGLQEGKTEYRAGEGASGESRAVSKVDREHGEQDGMESAEGFRAKAEPC